MPSCSSAQVGIWIGCNFQYTVLVTPLWTFNPQHAPRLVENGYIHKAVNYDGEIFVIEEIQAYENPVPINTLSLSASKVANCPRLPVTEQNSSANKD